MKKYLLIFLLLLLLIPNFFHKDIHQALPYNNIERFNPRLAYLNTIPKLEEYLDSIATATYIAPQTLAYVEVAANTIRDRFYHSFSHFSLNENWIAAISGKLIWFDLCSPVQPGEILKHSYAACSQQAIVFMAVLRDKHIPYRSILFPHHYALEILLNNKWYYFDTDMEPKISGEERCAENWHNSADTLKRYYIAAGFNTSDLDVKFGVNQKSVFGPINEIPAPHARLFQSVTAVLSKIAWLFPLLFLFYSEKKHPRKVHSTN